MKFYQIRTMLFKTYFRLLSALVVAIVLNVWLHSSLLIHLLLPLFRHEIVNRRRCINIFILWLHLDHGILILLIDRHNWFHGLFLVHSKDLQCCQSRLECNVLLFDCFYRRFLFLSTSNKNIYILRNIKWNKQNVIFTINM